MSERLSVIAATYNQPRELDLHLLTLSQQSHQNFELLLIDDGSGQETKDVIEKHRKSWAGDRLTHLWQENQGFRKSILLNRAIREAKTDWLVFTDSDTFLHPQFLADHHSMRARNRAFMGRRVDLASGVSEWIRTSPEKLFSPEFYARILFSGWGTEGSENVNRSFRVTNPLVSGLLGAHRVPDLLGSNFSIDRELLFSINGFDEKNRHYWGEDGDLYIRCVHAGAEMIGRKMFAVQFHLWHSRREAQPGAWDGYLQKMNDLEYKWCDEGLVHAQRTSR